MFIIIRVIYRILFNKLYVIRLYMYILFNRNENKTTNKKRSKYKSTNIK
jgi:hypothetical protein